MKNFNIYDHTELKDVLFDCLAKAITENFKITCK